MTYEEPALSSINSIQPDDFDVFYSYEKESKRSSADLTVDHGVHDLLEPAIIGGGSTIAPPSSDGGGGGGGGSEPLYQDGAYTGPFAIKINGSYSTSEGVTSQSSSFNIGVQGGTGTWPTKTQTFSGVSTSASAENEFYRVYGQITADYSTGSDVLDTWTNPSIEVDVATSGTTVGSNTRYINNGTDYTFYFLIGTVGITVQPSGGYRIFVNQVQIGNYTYGDAQGVASDDNGNDTRDGVRSLTICINGKPYKADFELTNIREAT